MEPWEAARDPPLLLYPPLMRHFHINLDMVVKWLCLNVNIPRSFGVVDFYVSYLAKR